MKEVHEPKINQSSRFSFYALWRPFGHPNAICQNHNILACFNIELVMTVASGTKSCYFILISSLFPGFSISLYKFRVVPKPDFKYLRPFSSRRMNKSLSNDTLLWWMTIVERVAVTFPAKSVLLPRALLQELSLSLCFALSLAHCLAANSTT